MRRKLRPPQERKAFLQRRSFFLISKKVAACPPHTIPICTLGRKDSHKPAIVPGLIVRECASKRERASPSRPRTTLVHTRHRRISFISFTTMLVRRRLAAHFREIHRPRQSAAFPTQRFGSLCDLRARWNSPHTARRATTRTATVTHPAILPMLG